MKHPPRWYEIRARGAASRHATVLIYGDIGGESWSESSVTAQAFVRELQALDADSITVRINSVGGSVPDGLAIFSALRRFDGEVTVAIDGVALSISSLIAMAGDHIQMSQSAAIMIHAPWSVAIGNAVELREQAAVLDMFGSAMVSAYARDGVDPDVIRDWLTSGADHWFSAEQALAAGLIDEIVESREVAASFPKSRFNPPAAIAARMRNSMTNPIEDPAALADETVGLTRARRRAARLEEQEAQARAQRAEGERNEIRNMYAAFRKVDGVQAMLEDVLARGVDAEAASKRLLAHLGKDAAPAVPQGAHPYVETLVDHDKNRRALATEGLMARVTRTVPKNPAARPFAEMRTVDLAREVLAWAGHRRDEFGSSRDTINAALTHGTSDFPVLLQETGARLLRQAYQAAPSGLKPAGRGVTVDDFRTQSRVQLSEAPALQLVPELAEYKAGSFAEAKESYSIATYGRTFGISRQALVNDDLRAFETATRRFGQA
ncbi:MAG: head maturation protease, ClpP-related, partial [Burkholderiaceae bacterium]